MVSAQAGVPARAPTKHGAMAEARTALREKGMGGLLGWRWQMNPPEITAATSLLISGELQAWSGEHAAAARKVKWSCQASRRGRRRPNRVGMSLPPRPIEPVAGPSLPAGDQQGDICKTAA